MNYHERPIHVTIKRWLEQCVPGAFVVTVKNELERKFATEGQRIGAIQRRKAEGVKAGFYDIAVFLPGGMTFCVEVKDKGGELSVKQQTVHAEMRQRGHPGCVADCIENVRWALMVHGIETREAAGQPQWPWDGRREKPKPSLAMEIPF